MIAALQTLMAQALAPLPVVWAYQDGQRPPKPYATIQARQSANAPFAVEGEPDANGDATVIEQRTLRAELNVFGPDAHRIASGATLRLRLPSLLDLAERLGLGLGPISPAMDIPELLNLSQYEERGMVEFTVYHVAFERDRVGLIEHVVAQDMTPPAQPPSVISSVAAVKPPPTL